MPEPRRGPAPRRVGRLRPPVKIALLVAVAVATLVLTWLVLDVPPGRQCRDRDPALADAQDAFFRNAMIVHVIASFALAAVMSWALAYAVVFCAVALAVLVPSLTGVYGFAATVIAVLGGTAGLAAGGIWLALTLRSRRRLRDADLTGVADALAWALLVVAAPASAFSVYAHTHNLFCF